MISEFLTKLSLHVAAACSTAPSTTLTPTVPCGLTNTPTSIGGVATTVTNILLYIVGIASVIMVIIGGFMYVISAGNPDKTKSARATIISALIGVVISSLAFVIVHYVIKAF